MKMRALSTLALFVLAWTAGPVLAADPLPPMPWMPKGFSVKSIDEQNLPESMKEKIRAKVRYMNEHKVIPASEHEVADFAVIEAEHRARNKAHPSTTFTPSNLDATTLGGQPLLGAVTHGVYNNNSWSGLSRLFSHPQLERVLLDETDLATPGGGATFTKEMINADINGAPGMILSQQGSEKKSITRLMWYAGGMLYELSIPRVDDQSRDALLDIARQLRR
ncbi:hypothetical protein Q4S45_17310 [Massilia sp. R2A-15]|uniref:hypothetical protein n=1 Tax=Massilia sp. R2A-15 TaxID=3064278 RepID=UPI002735CB83|nr:hypothetical protein [Massilia sp. R2A-15]WLI88471.1 hypothetical protein Q4S45_17310 [Massilia sp. R2A-15]